MTRLGESVGRGFVGWILLAIVLGIGFAPVAAKTITAYANSVIPLTSHNETLKCLVLPVVRRAPLAMTAANLGLTYGATAGVIVGVVALPALVTAMTSFDFVSPRARRP